MTLTDWELWAVANKVLQQHGENAPLHVAERIGALTFAGDDGGVAAWKGIERRLLELMGPGRGSA